MTPLRKSASSQPPGSRRAAALLLGLASCAAAAGEVIEQTIEVPVTVESAGRTAASQMITVTVVRGAGPGRRPFLVLHHGRGATAADRRAAGVQSYPANSRYFASLGFVVLIPTRVGYGVSGGPDVEYTGPCRSKQFDTGTAAAVSQTRQILRHAATLPYVDPDLGLIVGESFGGLVAIAAAAAGIRGVAGAVSIAGGDGGDARRRVDAPCRPDRLRDTFARYGRDNEVPTLWMYSRNDRVWGPTYPRQWFEAFVQAGGRGRFVELPADKNNGHFIFNRNAPAWRPAFEQFLGEIGFQRVPP